MLLKKVLGRLVGGNAASTGRVFIDEEAYNEAARLMTAGDTRGAVRYFRQYLEGDPYNVKVLNDIGACLAEIGDIEQASASFELAYSLDDTFIPAMVNHAKLLHDARRSTEALTYLHRAKTVQPNFMHADTVYSAIQMTRGDAPRARAYAQKAWMAGFDNLRTANSQMFWAGYDDIDEERIAAEHRFWAETVKPVPEPEGDALPEKLPEDTGQSPTVDAAGPRIRIGYWSPDFRNHSVRYFSRPLLQGHDHSRFEVFLLHDIPARDVQTDRFESLADHFYSVAELNDSELRAFIRSLDLDILVDLAGHTSHNRVNLLQYRMARVQINALGYPPTTGLRTVDAKLVDAKVATPEDRLFYAEQPLALPTSFWCFDPMEPAPLADEPPLVANGYVTFGCVGNIAKITERVARSWIDILAGVENSRLLLRSVSFADPVGLQAIEERLRGWGLPMDRIDLRGPEGSTALFTSYNGIDIMLDTFPFNGGTTTCFATYMGVPVVTLYGRSLISRMGLSIMTTLGEPGLAVPDLQGYVRAAIELAHDPERVRRFKQQARGTYKTTPLGNGELFAREFEDACADLLRRTESGEPAPATAVPVLPASELIRRAYTIMRFSQPEAAQRVLAHCLREYPDAVEAHLLHAQILVWAGLPAEGIAYVQRNLERFAPADRVPAWISLARMHLLQGDLARAREALAPLDPAGIADEFDRLQAGMYLACTGELAAPDPGPGAAAGGRMLFVVPCRSRPQFEELRRGIEEACLPPAGWTLEFERCDEDDRIEAYGEALARDGIDVVVMLQKNVQIHHPHFASQVLAALETADIVGIHGAARWSRLDWRFDEFAQKAGGFIGPSSESTGMSELHVFGPGSAAIVPGLAILDGVVLAVRRGGRKPPPFDSELLGSETLMEEAWSHAAGQASWRLASHRNLGVYLDSQVELDAGNRTEARLHCSARQGFDPFAELRDDLASLSAPVPTPATAVAVADAYFRPA